MQKSELTYITSIMRTCHRGSKNDLQRTQDFDHSHWLGFQVYDCVVSFDRRSWGILDEACRNPESEISFWVLSVCFPDCHARGCARVCGCACARGHHGCACVPEPRTTYTSPCGIKGREWGMGSNKGRRDQIRLAGTRI